MSDPPVRTCVGCRARRPQADLIRLHLDARSRLCIDRTGPGRGAWLCAASAADCLGVAIVRRALPRALRATPDPASVEEVVAALSGAPSTAVPTAPPEPAG